MTQNKVYLFLMVGLVLVLMSSIFTVGQREKAARFQFNKMIKSDYEPGLHFKIPLTDSVRKYDGRVLTLDSKPERFLTSEKKNVIVDSFVKWRIGDVKSFHTTVQGDATQANLRLDQFMKDAMRSEFSKRTIKELVSSDRKEIQNLLIANTQNLAGDLGIEVVDVRIKRIDLPPDVSSSVYRRMESERTRVAKEFRSQGSEQAEGIRADADKQREVILANAYRDAETIKGEGDGVSAATYAKNFGQDTEFFTFYRSINAYQRTFRGSGDLLVIEPDSEFFKYFNKAK